MKSNKSIIITIVLVLVAIAMVLLVVFWHPGSKTEDESSTENTSQQINTAEVLTDENGNLLATDENGETLTDENGSTKTESKSKTTTESQSTTAAKGDVLYIGRHEKKLSSTGNSAQALLSAMASETGWNLSTNGISSNSNTVFINWGSSSSLYTGAGRTSTNTYYCSDQETLDALILDSVKKTLQQNLGVSYVYYSDPNGEDLVLSDVNATIDSKHPYTSFDDYQEFVAN